MQLNNTHDATQVLHLVFGFGVNAWICLRAGQGPLGTLLPFLRTASDNVECRWELAVAPAHLVLSVYWTLKTASAYLAGRLGMSFTQLFDSHAMWNIVHAFDFVTGTGCRTTCIVMHTKHLECGTCSCTRALESHTHA